MFSGSARVPALSRLCMDSFWGVGRRGQQSLTASELFIERKTFYCPVYATLWCCSNLSQRTVSSLLMPGDVKLQLGQNSGAKVVLNSSQWEQEVPG